MAIGESTRWTTTQARHDGFPRLPLEGSIDLTYRCNSACRHCWLWIPRNATEKQGELSFEEIRRIAREDAGNGARALEHLRR